MPGDRARDAKNRAQRQARGTYDNTRELVGSFTFDQVLPASIADFLSEILALIPKAAGRRGAKSQVYSSITLILIALISTPFTLGYSLLLGAPFMITLLIGLLRLVPAANDRFQSARGDKLRDRDVPLWRRD